MMDETADKSNQEQVTIVIRWISEKFEVHEEFVGVYGVPSIDATTLTSVSKDTFVRLNLSISKLRGKCYDGVSSMKGARSGVAQRIMEEEPRALYTHCYGHSVNLATSDALNESTNMKNSLEMTHEITKLMKYSPRREAVFRAIKETHEMETGYHSAGLRILCPTRWTVHADSLASTIDNYTTLQDTCEEAVDIVKDTETKTRIRGVSYLMQQFDFFLVLFLARCCFLMLIISVKPYKTRTLQQLKDNRWVEW